MRKIQPKVINRYETKPIEKKPQKKYPSVTLDFSVLPEAKNWEIGKTYEVTLEVKMTALKMRKSNKQDNSSLYDSYDYENNATFDIMGVESSDAEDAESPTEAKDEEVD